MVDSSAHFRCDLGVMECCKSIVYPPHDLRSASGDDVVMGDDVVVVVVVESVVLDDEEDLVANNPGGRARVADDRRASQGLVLVGDAAGLVILLSIC
jgi:hypothetical protein